MFPGLLLLSLLQHVTVSSATENEVSSGCGFEPVLGQPQALKFCTAYGLCIKTQCNPGRVFSRTHCGCVQALFLKSITTTPLATTLRSTTIKMEISSRTTHLPHVETSIRSDYKYEVSPTAATSSQNLKTSSLKTLSTPTPYGQESTKNENVQIGYTGENLNATTIPVNAPPEKSSFRREKLSFVEVVSGIKSSTPTRPTTTAPVDADIVSIKTATQAPLQHTLPATEAEPATNKYHGRIDLTLSYPGIEDSAGSDVTAQSNSSRTSKHTNDTLKRTNSTTKVKFASPRPQSLRPTGNSTFISAVQPHALPETVNATRDSYLTTSMLMANITPRSLLQFISKPKKLAVTGTQFKKGNISKLACEADISIRGISSDNILVGDGALGLDYIGIRGVTSHSGSAHFNGHSFIWIPFSEVNRFTGGLTIIMSFKENNDFHTSQGLVHNCGNDGSPYFSISLDPKTSRINFKVMVTSTNTPYAHHEIMEASVPYTKGVSKTIEMQCSGQSMIAKVDSHVTGSHISSSAENYELASGTNPLYMGSGCREEETVNFHGDISNFSLYRCIRT